MNSSSLLWSIQSPEGKPGWLFGTMHIKDHRVYQFCQNLYPLILICDVYTGEMDLQPLPDLPVGPVYDIRTYIGTKTYFKMRHQIQKSFRLDVEPYAKLHPLLILSAISQSVLHSDHVVSLDEHLWDFAKNNQIRVQGLETTREQIDLLYSIEAGPLYKQILDVSTRPSTIRKYTAKAIKHYVSGEIHLLYQLTRTSMHKLRKRIIYNRNLRMTERIVAFDPTLSHFISVGAGHLSGGKGIITLLKRAGWKVRPVKMV